MKKAISFLFILGIFLAGCSPAVTKTPVPFPSPLSLPSPTPLVVSSPSETPTASPASTLTPSSLAPTATAGSGIVPGSPSGPYAVILVSPADVLNIRSGPGVGSTIVGSFAAAETNVMRTGPSTTADGDLWVEVQKPDGGAGWVNAYYLTEYAAPTAFCADARVNTLIASLGSALTSNNGEQLSGLVSPAHGMTVYLWRYGNSVTFEPDDARWVFESTYEHNWGEAPASGLETIGAFHVVVLPKLQDVFNASYSLTCNSLGAATQYGNQPWPAEYANVNFYTVYKPGTPGVDLDWRYWLVGVESVQGQPYVFALIHFQWEP